MTSPHLDTNTNLFKIREYNHRLQRLLLGPPKSQRTSAQVLPTLSSSMPRISPAKSGPYHREDHASPNTPDEASPEVSVLSLKFNSINNRTISKDKTQGEILTAQSSLLPSGRRSRPTSSRAFPIRPPLSKTSGHAAVDS
jgi:hypothetical protein